MQIPLFVAPCIGYMESDQEKLPLKELEGAGLSNPVPPGTPESSTGRASRRSGGFEKIVQFFKKNINDNNGMPSFSGFAACLV